MKRDWIPDHRFERHKSTVVELCMSTTQEEDNVSQAPKTSQEHKLRWRWIFAVACILVAVSVAYSVRSRGTRLDFTNESGDFQLQSVTVSKGIQHVDYFPSRKEYFLTRILPERRIGKDVGIRIDRTTSVESIGLWIRWKNRTGELHPRDIKVQTPGTPEQEPGEFQILPILFPRYESNTNIPGRRDANALGSILVAVNRPHIRSGEFLFVLKTNAWPSGDVVVKTPEGEATIHFK